jgi:hypothetical protein
MKPAFFIFLVKPETQGDLSATYLADKNQARPTLNFVEIQ